MHNMPEHMALCLQVEVLRIIRTVAVQLCTSQHAQCMIGH